MNFSHAANFIARSAAGNRAQITCILRKVSWENATRELSHALLQELIARG